MQEIPEVSTIKDGPKYLTFLTEKAIRWKLYSDEEFRRKCCRRLGRRIYLLPREIILYVQSQPV